MPGLGGTGALLSVVVFGIDLGQFLQTTPCERRFRTDARLLARPRIGSHWSFVRIKACSSYIYCTRAGEKEQTDMGLRDD